MFAKKLNHFSIHLFGQTVLYSDSLSLNVPFDPLRSEEPPQFHLVPHFRYISDISQLLLKNQNLILTLIQNCSRENASNYRVDVNSWELLCFCKGFPNFYKKWIQIYTETGLKEGHLSTPQHNEYISNANLLSKFQIRNLKRKWKIRYSFLFWLGKKSL